jgi:hypothetical protein
MSAAAVAARTVGQYPLSIATSLAMESATGIHPDKPPRSPTMTGYDEFWVNLSTLFRNLYTSMDKDAQRGTASGDLYGPLIEEMAQIDQIVKDFTKARTAVNYYVCNYKDLTRHRTANLRADKTLLQQEYTAIKNQVINAILAKNPGMIFGFDNYLKPKGKPKTVILTHVAYDLLSAKSFGELTLLESHTGTFKNKYMWYTKYHNGKELSMIPFREGFMQLFGDSELFSPMAMELRKAVIEVANKYSWSQVTTDEKIKYGIKQIQNPLARELLVEMLK